MLDSGFNKGNYAAISMRANAAKGTLGYQCRLSTEHGDNGISLTRDGKSLSGACPRRPMLAMNRYSTATMRPSQDRTLTEICQIQERVKSASLFSKDRKYTVSMELWKIPTSIPSRYPAQSMA